MSQATATQDRSRTGLAHVGRGPWRVTRRRRRLPMFGLGGLLVVVCVLAYAYGAVRLGDRVLVLAVARPIAAGQPIRAADLTQVPAALDPSVTLVPAGQLDTVVGRTAVVPLLAGTLLTPAVLGTAAFPPPGQLTASVALRPGQYPNDLRPGANVAVYVSSSQPAATGPAAPAAPQRLPAVVLAVDLTGDGQGSTVVTLLLDAAHAATLAGAPSGGVVLMQTSPGAGG